MLQLFFFVKFFVVLDSGSGAGMTRYGCLYFVCEHIRTAFLHLTQAVKIEISEAKKTSTEIALRGPAELSGRRVIS